MYVDADGNEVEKPGYTDRAATEAMLAKLVQLSARIASGLLPPEAAVPRVPMSELIERWEAHLNTTGGEEHAYTQRRRVERIVEGLGATRPADFTPGRVAKWLAEQRTARKNFGATNAFHHAGAVKSFTRWLCRTEKYEPVDHLSALSRSHDETDRRHVRRVLSAEDLGKLLDAARSSSEPIRGLEPLERAILYVVAASTGLRARELASLTVGSFDLVAAPASVVVEAGYAKNRRRDELYIPDSLLGQLKVLVKGRKPDEKVWPDRTGSAAGMWWRNAAKMLRVDLAAAGIPYADERGRVFDFHSLRSQFITDLDRAGVSLSRAQKLARHCTPALTAKHYSRPERAELAADVNRLAGRFLPPALSPESNAFGAKRLDSPLDFAPKKGVRAPRKSAKKPSARGGT